MFLIADIHDYSFADQWIKTFGGAGWDIGRSVQQTDDGGFIIAGETYSFGIGNSDVYLIKTDAAGYALWSKTFCGDDSEFGYSVQQTSDGGFIITGETESTEAGGSYVYLVYFNETRCQGDLEPAESDGDVDGSDLATLINGGSEVAWQTSSCVLGQNLAAMLMEMAMETLTMCYVPIRDLTVMTRLKVLM